MSKEMDDMQKVVFDAVKLIAIGESIISANGTEMRNSTVLNNVVKLDSYKIDGMLSILALISRNYSINARFNQLLENNAVGSAVLSLFDHAIWSFAGFKRYNPDGKLFMSHIKVTIPKRDIDIIAGFYDMDDIDSFCIKKVISMDDE